jgi:NitT/TauT family transport system substrate-binding protein
MKINLRTTLATTIVLFTAIILSACSSVAPAPSADLPAIRIGGNQWIGNGPLYIALAKGFFAKEGVKVEFVNFDSTSASDNAFATKQLDAVLTSLPDVVAQAAAKVPVQVVWVTDSSQGADFVVGTSAIKSPADLKGKRIGMAYGSFGHFFVLSGLAKYGISRDDVTIVNVTVDGIPQALADGKIDAGHVWDPYAAEAIKNGAHVVFTSADTPGAIDDIMAFQTSVTQKRPDDVKAILRALQAGSAYWAANPDEGNQIVAKEIGASPSDIPGILQTVHLPSVSEVQAALDPNSPSSLYKSVSIIGDFFTKEKVIQQAPEPQTLLNSTFVASLSTNK